MKRLASFAVIITIIALANFNTISAQVCGNCDNDPNEKVDIADLTCYIAYLFVGLEPPAGNMEVDDYEGVTVRDWMYLHDHLWTNFVPLTCPPTNPKYVTIPDSSFEVSLSSSIPSGSSSIRIPIYLGTKRDLSGIQLPIRVSIDGDIPSIDSLNVTEDLPALIRIGSILQETGEFVINIFPTLPTLGLLDNGPDPVQLANLFLSFPPTNVDRNLTAVWTILSPVQAPQPDSSVTPAVYSGTTEGAIGWEPILRSFACGDVDGSGGRPDITDLTFLIDHLFINFPPLPNPLSGNVDGLGKIDIGDVTFLIDHLFLTFAQVGC